MYARTFYVYIMTNEWNTTFYIGTTGGLEGRVWQHKTGQREGFTKQYHLKKLYYEEYDSPMDAIRREKQLKNWHRKWKTNLIQEQNPDFQDMAADWYDTERQDNFSGDAETSSAWQKIP